MTDFAGLVLCDWYGDGVEVHVRADMTDGVLTFSGQDLGPYVEKIWGDTDYEYWYTLDKENTRKLLRLIDGDEEPETALLQHFCGEGGCRMLREICNDNDITYQFFSYA